MIVVLMRFVLALFSKSAGLLQLSAYKLPSLTAIPMRPCCSSLGMRRR